MLKILNSNVIIFFQVCFSCIEYFHFSIDILYNTNDDGHMYLSLQLVPFGVYFKYVWPNIFKYTFNILIKRIFKLNLKCFCKYTSIM